MSIRSLAQTLRPQITDTIQYNGSNYPLTRLKGHWGVLREGTLVPLELERLVKEGNKWVYHPELPTAPVVHKGPSHTWNVRIAFSNYDKMFTVAASSEGEALSKALGVCSRETGKPIPLLHHLMKQSSFRPKPERL